MAAAGNMKKNLILIISFFGVLFFAQGAWAFCLDTASWQTPAGGSTNFYTCGVLNNRCGAYSCYNNQYACDKALDNNLNTYWTNIGGEWIFFDFGAKKCISGVQVAIPDYNGQPITMDIQVASDPAWPATFNPSTASWTTVVSGWTVSSFYTWVTKNFSEVSARYIRIYETSYPTYASLSEFKSLFRTYSDYVIPTVTTDTATIDVQNNQALLRGNIIDIGGTYKPDFRGFEWGTTLGSYPNSWTEGTSGLWQYVIGGFSYNLTGLSPGTIYYYRAKAHNPAGWGYGAEKKTVIYIADGSQAQFTTLSDDTAPPTAEITAPSIGANIWYRSLDVQFKYSDSGGSGLSICDYKVESRPPGGTFAATLDWTSAGGCSGNGPLTLNKTIPANLSSYCNKEGTDVCRIWVRAYDNNPSNTPGMSYKTYNIDFTPPTIQR